MYVQYPYEPPQRFELDVATLDWYSEVWYWAPFCPNAVEEARVLEAVVKEMA